MNRPAVRSSTAGEPPTAARDMDRMYRYQRYIYDATRKFYLLGRDGLIDGLAPPANGRVLEIACGTGRNLVHAARRYPAAALYGLDVSDEMLKSARQAIDRHGVAGRVRLAQADATSFDPQALFGVRDFDRIFISYAVSMIPPWRRVIAAAFGHVAPGGSLHVVDFGQLERLPGLFRRGLFAWLAQFHVMPRADLRDALEEVAAGAGARLDFRVLRQGYAYHAVLHRPATPPPLQDRGVPD